MDTDSPIVRLCIDGMAAEIAGSAALARERFQEAWDRSTNDYEAAIAAHYLARQQDYPGATLRWNEEALARARKFGDESVTEFYPSLLLNVGDSLEKVGRLAEAHERYVEALGLLRQLDPAVQAEHVIASLGASIVRTRCASSTVSAPPASPLPASPE